MMIMRKLSSTIFPLLIVLIFAVSAFGGAGERPWSTTTNSSNNQFTFVLISNGNLDKYADRTRKSWEFLKLSPQELKDYESYLSQAIDEEKQIRNLYPNSGLYLKDNPKNLLWILPKDNTQNWVLELDTIFVADDGSFVVGYNPQINEIKNNVLNKEETGVFIYSRDFGLKSYKVSALTDLQDKFSKWSEGAFWAKNEPIVIKENKIFVVTKQNESKIEFDISTGEILPKERYSSCLGFLLLLVLSVWFRK